MPTAPKRHRPSHLQGGNPQPDRRKGFRGRKRQDAKLRIWLRDDCSCKACGRSVALADSRLDHIQPLAMGGTHDDSNLQTLCAEPCHRLKSAKEGNPPHQF